MYKKILCVILSICIAFAMAGCGSVKDLIGNDEDDAVYEESKNVNFAMSQIHTLNPVISQDQDTYYISRLIYQSLFKLDSDLTPVKDLASDYDISKTGKSVIISLDKATRFSDGEKVTAQDVKFSIDAYEAAGKKCKFQYNVKDIKRVDIESSTKVKIVFEDEGGSLAKLTFPILPSHKYDISQLTDKDFSFKPIGSGAYKISKYEKNESLVLKPNKEYSGEKPENVLRFTTYEKKSKAINLLDGNLVSFTTNESMDREKEIGGFNLRNGEYYANKMVFMGFNCEKAYLENEKVRQAICTGIDTSSILQKAFYGSGELTDSIFLPGYLGMENTGDVYKYDKKHAREMLEAEGWKDKNKDGYIEPKGKKNSFKILVGESASRKKAAKFIVSDLEEVGIECEVKACSDKAFKSNLKKGKFDMYIGEISFGAAYDLTDFIGGSLDYTGYEDSKLSKKIAKTGRIHEAEDLLKNAEEIKTIMNEKVFVYPFLYKTYSYIISDELQGEVDPMFDDIYRGCEKWSSKYEVKETEEDKEK